MERRSGDGRKRGDRGSFVERENPPELIMGPARSALDLFDAYLASGRFQLG